VRRIGSSISLVTSLILFLTGAPVPAQTTYFPEDAAIDYAVPGTAVVGRDSMGRNSSPTIDFVAGGSSQTLLSYNRSALNVAGGAASFAFLFDSSTINISEGGVGSLYAYDSSVVNVVSGSGGMIEAYGSNRVTITGGTFGGVFTSGGTVNMSGGTIWGSLSASDSVVNLSAGLITNIVDFSDCTVNVSGGATGYVYSFGKGNFTVTGGDLSGLNIYGTSLFNIYGGSFSDGIRADNDSIVNLYGHDLALANPVPDGPFATQYDLTGTLSDGTILAMQVFEEDNGQILLHEVPEPGSLALLFAGSLSVCWRMRCRARHRYA
jgi:hypothetical protein